MDFDVLNKSILGKSVAYFDKVALHQVSNINVAKIILSTRSHDKKYVGYKVTIINKANGVIDGKFFNWNDYFDTTKDYKEFEINEIGNWNKYPTDDDIRKFRDAIFKYIAFFR